MKSNSLFLILLTLFLANEGVAQPKLWEVYSVSNQPFVNVVIDRYESDSIYIKSMNQVIVLHQDSIRYLVYRHHPNMAIGFVFGAAAGGFFMSEMSRGSSGLFADVGRTSNILVGVALGGLIGGAVGAAGNTTRYEIYKMDPAAKKKLLATLFPKE